MLKLIDIVKNYRIAGTEIKALRGINLEFRKSEFVSILGPSGCGKTTMLNIIGGLDRYTSGDLIISGVSTKEYKETDWDIYRNNSIGFVFQSYNLITHQSVLANVELAMTLAGVSRAERRKRATEVLEKVGLGDQLNKKPTQLSGGQMQRVAIARALVNNPEILLADEPTGALDSETSTQIMDVLREIAKDRLVIMVTHNGDIAEKYSSRIIKLLDGKVINDSNPYSPRDEADKKSRSKRKKISMSFSTALSLSLRNLMTKKTRTILTAFAGSIGIIGIALILSLSSGMQGYINSLESDTLSTYPIVLEGTTMDMTSMMTSFMQQNRQNEVRHDPDRVYANSIMTDMVQSVSTQLTHNDLGAFKKYIESSDGQRITQLTNSIKYGYNIDPNIYGADASGRVLKINPSDIYANFNTMSGGNGMSPMMGGGNGAWEEMLDNDTLLHSQYDVIAGRWPAEFNEIVLVVDDENELSDMVLYSLGLLDADELKNMMNKIMRGEEIINTSSGASFSYDEILSLTYKLVLNTDYYVKEQQESGHITWVDMSNDEAYMKGVIDNAAEIKVVGILRPSSEAAASSISGSVGYTSALTDYVINSIHDSEIAKEQLAAPDIDVFTGIDFETTTGDDPASYVNSSYDENLRLLGIVDFDTPGSIGIYPKNFDSKKEIETIIKDYNEAQEEAGHEELVIIYTDIVGLMTSSISDIINIISYVLIAFVAISLVVSSIMIAIITYISVLERTKEIGILRSIGASKKDISRVFNAETIIEGFVAGTMGVLITMLLNIPVNAIIKSLTEISNVSELPLIGAIILIVISVLLSVIAGFIPSRKAAKKDPVEALRIE